MATNNGGQPDASEQPQQVAPQLGVLAQYTKDLSFENPNAPQSLQPQQQQPAVNININVTPRQLSATDYEVELKLEGMAEVDKLLLFSFDLTYAGVFRLQNIAQDTL